jgi:pilus assembly protein Flp/PilA
LIRRFAADESGATAVEYGLICALIFVAVLSAVFSTGNETASMFNATSNRLSNAHQGAGN